ncbi:acyl-CoA dehydrogenase C-terminal domain-containing protein [Ampullimonas aquatilis]|uniref:acyl-CoA dehydrogenase C-terminal domain-containing protein n=1 Tax=Ampullimonas aquatilis TaxID=1341549 RepID=UPI003C747653
MPHYTPPIRDVQFILHELLQIQTSLQAMPAYAEVDVDTINAVLEEGGKFCAEVLFPLNQPGDQEGCHYDRDNRSVTTPKGYRAAYQQFVDAGWPALACDPQYGGQGLPMSVNIPFMEMLCSGSHAWAMYPGLTHGAYECIHAHGSAELKALYLPRLVAGEWSATMCLTEAHCGTDLGLLRTRAEPQTDGSFHLTGGKIFISGGEHDLSQNIIHLVLARLPDAPAGSKGISLFVVPKIMVHPDGSLGDRNAIYCGAIEHKMGIHGNATCQMNLDGATGYLLGEPNRGLAAMFVMMNAARLGVGIQPLGLSEVAYQNAAAYAKERLQSRSLSGKKSPDLAADPIIVHPDVRRMLLTARAYTEGGRALAYFHALLIDQELNHPDETVRKDAADLVALLTPVVKAFLTDNGCQVTNECLQVFGGHGYIQEWGMEQLVRDARICTIYEGTNTIQSLDLLGRKVLSDMGARLKKFGKLVRELIEAEGVVENMQEFINPLADLADKVEKLTMEIAMKAMKNQDEVGAAAVPYLRVVGHLMFAYLWTRMVKIALSKQSDDAFYQAKLATARFYFARLLPETAMLIRQARSGADNLMQMDADLF